MAERELISFDWAMKRVLRSPANFGVLNGFLSVLLNEKIEIEEILESESNRAFADDKSNRLDLKVRDTKGELILIEIQYDYQFNFFQRMLYGASKTVVEHIYKGDNYEKVVKVISINILNFDLGKGEDYVYIGKTSFIGLHKHDKLKLDEKQQKYFDKKYPEELFPEYYLIKVKNFDDLAKTPLDEWIYFLKNSSVKESFTAPGLSDALEKLSLMQMSREERMAYDDYIDMLRQRQSAHMSAKMSGIFEGRAEGLKEGLKQGIKQGIKQGKEEGLKEGGQKKALEIARKMLKAELSFEQIADITGLTVKEIKNLH